MYRTLLNVSESAFHAQRTRSLCKLKRETCIAKRLHSELADYSAQTMSSRVRKLRKKLSLRSKQ